MVVDSANERKRRPDKDDVGNSQRHQSSETLRVGGVVSAASHRHSRARSKCFITVHGPTQELKRILVFDTLFRAVNYTEEGGIHGCNFVHFLDLVTVPGGTRHVRHLHSLQFREHFQPGKGLCRAIVVESSSGAADFATDRYYNGYTGQ